MNTEQSTPIELDLDTLTEVAGGLQIPVEIFRQKPVVKPELQIPVEIF